MGPFHRIERKIAELAERQYGHVTRIQAMAAGLPSRAVDRWIAQGRFVRVHTGVYAYGYLRVDAVARAAAAALACGPKAVLSHETAAALWGFWSRWPQRPEIAGPQDRRRPNIRYHHTQTLERQDVRRHQGLRVTSPVRTLIDIRPRLTRRQFTRAVNDARLAGYLPPGDLERLHPLIPITSRPTRSSFEDDFPAFARKHDLPEPEMNARVAGYECDAVFWAERVIVELDGWEFHQGHPSFEDDRERDVVTLAAGYVTVRLTWERYAGRPVEEARRLDQILRARRAETRAA